jgi:cysteinyl-tRNA synthetase
MYVCGITSYDESHLGHARCYVVFDVIRRYLEYSGFDVRYVQNFTDIDDKIIKRAEELKKSPKELAEKYIEKYHVSSNKLNIKPADKYPKVTEHIREIISSVDKLIKGGYAYVADDGSVYFSVRKFSEYGKLSKRNIDEMMAGCRIESKKNKLDPLDFALWKSANSNESCWESPWGKGRPGWHIECSVMSMQYLGETLDIHGGGQDLVFPHHENEIAQSESLAGKEFAKYWIHNGFVTINREKMSKSLGNFFTLEEIFSKYRPMVVRYFLLSQHYRKPIDFSDDKLEQAKKSLERLAASILNAYSVLGGYDKKTDGKKLPAKIKKITDRFEGVMNDDFNTEAAISEIHNLCTELNKEQNRVRGINKDFVFSAKEQICNLMERVLGIKIPVYTGSEDTSGRVGSSKDRDSTEHLIKQREKARKEKNWQEADRIRKRLQEIGVVVEDTLRGPRVKKI